MAIHALFIGNPVNRVQEKAVAFTQGVALQMIEAGKLPLIAVLLRERFRGPGNQGVIFLQICNAAARVVRGMGLPYADGAAGIALLPGAGTAGR